MKARLTKSTSRRACCSIAAWFLATGTAVASPPALFNGAGQLVGVPIPGVLVTNGIGQVFLKGNVHIMRLAAEDPRVSGRLQAMPDVAFQPDGTRIFVGTAWAEVGTWDLANPAKPQFIPSGGLWNLNYRGVTQVDGSIQYSFAGYGLGGGIDGLRVEASATRGPGPSFDPAIPYRIEGTILPPPDSTQVVIDRFDGELAGWEAGGGSVMPTVNTVGERLAIRCEWSGILTAGPFNTLAWAGHDQSWEVLDGHTVELCADLAALNAEADSAVLAFAVQRGGPNYVLLKGHDWVVLMKQTGAGAAALCGNKAVLPDSGIILSLALTRSGEDVRVTGRVSNKASPAVVLYERTYLDTPAADRVLNSQELAELLGGEMNGLGSDPDLVWTSGKRIWLGVWQNSDGKKGAAEALFDNVELRTSEIPPIGIGQAVRLSWPASGTTFGVEAGDTVQGPWFPVQDGAAPGVQQITIPAKNPAAFFRLRKAP